MLLNHLRLANSTTATDNDDSDSGEGNVRISFCHYNTLDEARRLMDVLESIDGWW